MALKKSNQFDTDEVFRRLRTNIEFMRIEDDIKVVNVTSTTKNEGKTTVATNLARIFAAKYPNVLLIDCDLRNSSVHRELEISNSAGLTDVLATLTLDSEIQIGARSELKRVRYGEEAYELAVMTAGTRVPNPAEIVASRRFKKFLELAREQYNYIIIDCPPVGFVSDAIPVSNLSDGTLYVASAKEHLKKEVRMTIKDMRRNGVNILGLALNKVDMSTKRYGYGYYYEKDPKKKKKGFLK